MTADTDTRAIEITASDVTIATLTITGAAQGIHVGPAASAGTTHARIYRVHLVDNVTGVQINASADAAGGLYADAGSIECSTIEVSDDRARVRHDGRRRRGGRCKRDWTVRDTRFANLSCSSSFIRTLRFSRGSRGTDVIGNMFVNGVGNIMLGADYTSGDALRTYTDAPACVGPTEHRDGIVCNNTISGLDVRGGSQPFEEGIALWNTCGDTVAHNSIVAPPGRDDVLDDRGSLRVDGRAPWSTTSCRRRRSRDGAGVATLDEQRRLRRPGGDVPGLIRAPTSTSRPVRPRPPAPRSRSSPPSATRIATARRATRRHRPQAAYER